VGLPQQSFVPAGYADILINPIDLMSLTNDCSPSILVLRIEMEREPQFSKCANAECAVPFNFRQGRLFRFYRNHPVGNAAPVNPYSLKHLWLCRDCVELYTLEYHEGRGLLIPLAASKPFPADVLPEPAVMIEEIAVRRNAKPAERSRRKAIPKQHTRIKHPVDFLGNTRRIVVVEFKERDRSRLADF
jgi:hypothetical protein